MPPALPIEGGCRCGQVRFRIDAQPMMTMACHCRGCRQMSGSAFSLNVAVPSAALAVTRGETVIGVSLAGAAVIASGVGGWVSRTFLESYRISVAQAEAYFREPMVQGYLLAAHQIAQTMETPSARDEGLSRVMDGFLAAGLECARSRSAAAPGAQPES